MPLAFKLGEAFPFDWSEERLVGKRYLPGMQVSHLKLCASRAFWLVADPSQGHEMHLQCPSPLVRSAGRHCASGHLRLAC